MGPGRGQALSVRQMGRYTEQGQPGYGLGDTTTAIVSADWSRDQDPL